MPRYYVDYAASAPLLPEAWAAMVPWLRDEFGNPSSIHAEGRRAKGEIDAAREVISAGLGCLFGEVIFTSGGTEAGNLVLLGAAMGRPSGRNRVLISEIEHECVLACAEPLQRLGLEVEFIPCNPDGVIEPEAVEERLGDDVLLVSVMHANNELGTLQPIAEIGAVTQSNGALFHTDAVQTFGHMPFSMQELPVDMVSVSAHKLGGPKGIGALAVRAGTSLAPMLVGGGQEREMRAGTENVGLMAGFAAAFLAASEPHSKAREAFFEALTDTEHLRTVPEGVRTLLGHAHVRFPGVRAETLLIRLDRAGVSASSGAACSSGSIEPSHVMIALGLSEGEALESIRFTFGPTDSAEIGRAVAKITVETVASIREGRGS